MVKFFKLFSRVIVGFFLVSSLCGFTWANLWHTKDQQGAKTFSQKEFKKAAAQFSQAQWRGVANYRAGDYQLALKDFQSDQTSDAYYNLGNAQAKSGMLNLALHSYDQAITSQTDFPDAKFNREIVRKLLNEQKKDKQKKSGEKQRNQENKNNKASKQGEQPDQNQAQQQASQGDGQQENKQADNKKEQQQAEANNTQQKNKQTKNEKQQQQQLAKTKSQSGQKHGSSLDEQQQADMQWMQQIIDDPGGLLRRKFLRDHQRRIQQARGW